MARSSEILMDLRRPFTPDAVRFKIQSGGVNSKGEKSKALIVAFIDARLVIERLNHVVGLDWSAEYQKVDGGLACHLTVLGTTRTDVGVAESNAIGGIKALYSDALKRAGVQFGIGVSVYALPKEYLDPPELRYYQTKNGIKAALPDAAEKKLRVRYAAWLDAIGVEKFGEPIDHGDAPDAVGETPSYVDADGEVHAAPAAGRQRLTPSPAHEQQQAHATGNPATGSLGTPRTSAAPPVAPETVPRDADGKVDTRSPAEMAADAMLSWLPRGQSKAAAAERELIKESLALLQGITVAELPNNWSACCRMLFGYLGEAIQSREECSAALAAAIEAKTMGVPS